MSEDEYSLVVVKPSAFSHLGPIIERLQRDFTLEAISTKWLDVYTARQFYAEHEGKDFLPAQIDYMTSGRVVAIVVSGPDAIARVRKLVGDKDPIIAKRGTLRKRFGQSKGKNGIHASDSPEAAEREMKILNIRP